MSSLLTLVSVSGLFDATLKSAAILLLAMMAAALLRRASAAWRHLVWCLSVSSLLLLPVLSLVLPDWRVIWLPRWTDKPTQRATMVPTELPQANRTEPLDEVVIVLPAATTVSETEPHGQPQHLPSATIEATSSPRLAMSWLTIAWTMGGLLSLVRLAIGLGQLVGLHRRSQAIGDRRWLALLDDLRRQLAVRRRVRLRECQSALAPLTWGALRPVLLVPFEAGGWPDERRRLVLLHELAHVRRWDWLTQLFAHVACAVYWFNPLVWWAARQMRIERERACDDLVLNSGARPSDYARELLALAMGLSHSQRSMLAAVPMARRGLLDDRVRGILDNHRSRSALSRASVGLGVALAAAAMVPLAMVRAAPPAREQGTGNGEQRIGSSGAPSESTTAEPTNEPPVGPVNTLEMTVNTSRILTMGKPVPRAHVNHPEVAEITALSPNRIQVIANKPGMTQVNLFDEHDNVYTVDTIVYPDAREFRLRQSRRQTAEPKEKPAAAPSESLEMTVNTSRILSIGKPVPRVQVNDPEVVEITALSENQVKVMAKKPGTTPVNLFDKDDNVYTVDAIVYPDARELRLSLKMQFSMDSGPAGRQAGKVDDLPSPPALNKPEVKEIWDLTLEEAVRSALAKSKTLRNLGGLLLTPVEPQSSGKDAAGQGTHGSVRDPEATGNTKVKLVLARTRDDLALTDFEAGVRAMLSDVERAYWDLYFNYRNLNAVQAGRDGALANWRKVHALYIADRKGGEAEKETQAREQYFLFRAQVENTLGQLYTAEGRLRNMMGVAPTDGRLIRPADEPTTTEVRFDLNELVPEALNRSVELRRQRWVVEQSELKLAAALLAMSDVETAKSVVAESKAMLGDQEMELAHVLTNCVRDLDRNYQVSITTFNRRVSAAKQMEAAQATYDAGTATLDMLLDAQRRLADAEIAYWRAIVDYNVAILQVHYRKNSLLEYNGIMLAEGTRAGSEVRKK